MAKLTRKSYKRKKIAFAAVILGGVALVSSGFAAWVLSNTKDTQGNGKVNVGEIVDSSLTMKVEYKIKGANGGYTEIGKNKIGGNYCFDAAKEDTTGRIKYLKGDGEQLSILYKVTIESKENVFSGLKVTFEHNDNIDQAVENGFIVASIRVNNTTYSYFTINGKTFYTGYNSDYAAAHNISFPVVKNDVLVFNKTIIGSDGTNYIYFIPYK